MECSEAAYYGMTTLDSFDVTDGFRVSGRKRMAVSRVHARYRNADQKASIPNCNSAISEHGNVACQQDKDRVYGRLVSASRMMNDAFHLLSTDGCSVSAAKLADAIVYLDVTLSHRRAAASS